MKNIVLISVASLLISCSNIKPAPRPVPIIHPSSLMPGGRQIVPIVKIPPHYPRIASNEKQEGWALLSFAVTTKGETANIKVVDSSPKGVFDKSAIRAIKYWLFKPEWNGRENIESEVEQLMLFKINN